MVIIKYFLFSICINHISHNLVTLVRLVKMTKRDSINACIFMQIELNQNNENPCYNDILYISVELKRNLIEMSLLQ